MELQQVDPWTPAARAAMAAYFAELDERFAGGFDAGPVEGWGLDALTPPEGVFVLALEGADAQTPRTIPHGDPVLGQAVLGETVLGCGGVQTIDDGVGEVKRMWVADAARGRGLGRRLLEDLEARSAALGHTVLRLDTNSVLTSAVSLYARAGYAPIKRYNDNPYPDLFFEKRL